MNDLLAGGDSDGEIQFSINKNYATNYSNWRQKEVYQKLKDRVGRQRGGNNNETSSSEDDEDAKDLARYEKGFFKALSYLKKKDPRIYNENIRFFPNSPTSKEDNNEVNGQKLSREKKDKPFVLRDYERQIIMEKEGKLSDDDEIAEKNPRSSSPTYIEEQRALKESFKNVLENSDAEDAEDDGFGNLFKKKKKTEAEREKEEEDYKEWLKGRKDKLKDKSTESDLKGLHDFWNDPNLNSDEVFLRDYILNKRFLDPEDEEFQPEHNEIVHDDCRLEIDQKYVDQMETFEHKYNFRFEEPDPEFIKRYPRSVESSLRRKDDRRKIKREEIKARKETEMAVKREEIKQLKALKKKEILAKIEKIKEITGNDDVDFQDEDFEEDFNPEKHDQKMKELFSDGYYEIEETDKPEFPELDQDLEIEDWENWQGKDEENEQCNGYDGEASWEVPQCEDPNFNMDCDYDPKADLQEELKRMSKSKKKQKRKTKFAEALAKKKPIFDPSDKKFEEYLDEYYQLDCEDIIDDLPCRFKYRKTTPNDYGLTIDEILRADAKELNKWCSLKKVVKYKPDHVENYEVQIYRQKASNEALKRKILPSLYKSTPDNNFPEYENVDDTFVESKKKKGKKKKYSEGEDLNFETEKASNKGTEYENSDLSSGTKKKKKKKAKYNEDQDKEWNNTPDDHRQENGDVMEHSEVKIKKKKKKSKGQDSYLESESVSEGNFPNIGNETNKGDENVQKKKKNKNPSEGHDLNSEPERRGRVNQTYEEGTEESQNIINKKKQKKRKYQGSENGEVHSSEISKKQKFDCSDNSVFNSEPKKLNKRKERHMHSDERNKMYNYNKKNNKHFPQTEIPISDTRLKAYGIHPKKFKNKLKYGNKPNLWE